MRREQLRAHVLEAFDCCLQQALPKNTRALPVRVKITLPARGFTADGVVL